MILAWADQSWNACSKCRIYNMYLDSIRAMVRVCVYSGTSLIRTPMGQKKCNC